MLRKIGGHPLHDGKTMHFNLMGSFYAFDPTYSVLPSFCRVKKCHFQKISLEYFHNFNEHKDRLVIDYYIKCSKWFRNFTKKR